MHRLFLQKSALRKQPIAITDEQAHYLFSVLRCKPGQNLVITDETGLSYTARILSSAKKEVTVDIVGAYRMETESSLNIVLVQGLLKGEKMDFVIQKATELGVRGLIPVITERSQLRATRKQPRWQKIAEEASRQSGRTKVPEISEPRSFEEVLDLPGQSSGKGIIFWEQGGEKLSAVTKRLSPADQISLLIGPEGGFSEQEAALATEKGFDTATLGNRILRAETAAIAVVSIISYSLGDLGA